MSAPVPAFTATDEMNIIKTVKLYIKSQSDRKIREGITRYLLNAVMDAARHNKARFLQNLVQSGVFKVKPMSFCALKECGDLVIERDNNEVLDILAQETLFIVSGSNDSTLASIEWFFSSFNSGKMDVAHKLAQKIKWADSDIIHIISTIMMGSTINSARRNEMLEFVMARAAEFLKRERSSTELRDVAVSIVTHGCVDAYRIVYRHVPEIVKWINCDGTRYQESSSKIFTEVYRVTECVHRATLGRGISPDYRNPAYLDMLTLAGQLDTRKVPQYIANRRQVVVVAISEIYTEKNVVKLVMEYFGW